MFHDKDLEYAPSVKLLAGTRAVEEALEGEENGVAITGAGSARRRRQLKSLTLEGIEATHDTIASGTYPLFVPLYITAASPKEPPRVTEFIQYVLSPEGQALLDKAGTVSLDSGKNRAVTVSNRVTGMIDEGLRQVQSSGNNMRELSAVARESSAKARDIATAVQRQTEGIGQIFAAVMELSHMMNETISRIDSTSAAAQVVERVSGRVYSVVKAFTVDTTRNAGLGSTPSAPARRT